MNKGDVLIIPTDTVYGLATRLFDDEGLKKIYELKGRDLQKQIPILISSIDQLEGVCEYDDFTRKVMETFWPGPLTLILKTTDKFKQSTAEDTIAVRMPNHSKALFIIEQMGILRVTSLNKSGEPPLDDHKEIKKVFGPHVRAIFWQTKTDKPKLASTVARVENYQVDILREGVISAEDILSLRANKIIY